MSISTQQLAEWKRLVNEATPEPWESHGAAMSIYGRRRLMFRFMVGDQHTGMQISAPDGPMSSEYHDARFITAAREAVPKLIAEIERLQAVVDAYKAGEAK